MPIYAIKSPLITSKDLWITCLDIVTDLFYTRKTLSRDTTELTLAVSLDTGLWNSLRANEYPPHWLIINHEQGLVQGPPDSRPMRLSTREIGFYTNYRLILEHNRVGLPINTIGLLDVTINARK